MVHRLQRSGILYAMIVVSCIAADATAAEPYPGYIFCASGQKAYLIDPTGTTVHTWQASSSARSCAYLLPDGGALFPIRTECPVKGDGAYPHGRLQKISWEGKVVWDAVVCDNTMTPGYDLEPMPNGNILVAGASSTGGLKIMEIKPSGASEKTVVWEYNLPDSLGKSGYINSVSYNPELKYIGIDINQIKKLVVIDYEKKSIVYTYKVSSGTATHAAMWVTKYFVGTDILVPDADHAAMRTNNLLVVNNSDQVVEVNPVAKTFVKNISFEFSQHEGSVQRLPNGNTFVCPQSSRATELDGNGAKVRTVTLPGSVARAYMYGPAYPGLKTYTNVKAATRIPAAAGTFTYNAAVHTCTITAADAKGTALDVRIFSLRGEMLYSSSSLGTTAVFSTKHLTPGIYFCTVNHSYGSFRACFAKVK